MQRIAGAYGNSSRDEYVSTRDVYHSNGILVVELCDGSTESLQVPPKPSKITLKAIPESFTRNVIESKAGGGAVNSCLAAESTGTILGQTNEIRKLDANEPDPLIQSEVPPPARHLSLRPCPRNYVFGSGEDKWIFRTPISPAAPLGHSQRVDIAWLNEAQTILINGAKDIEPVDALIAERDRRSLDLILVLTSSLPVGFLCDTVLPAADVVIAAWDEVGFLTGDTPLTVEGAALAAACLGRLAPRADVHVTMGKRGVTSLAAGSAEPSHIQLDDRSLVAREAQALVRERPSRLTGAGDAFAGGVLARRAFGLSLLSRPGSFDPHVEDALSGCASALRWIAVTSALPAGAFDIRSLPVAAAP